MHSRPTLFPFNENESVDHHVTISCCGLCLFRLNVAFYTLKSTPKEFQMKSFIHERGKTLLAFPFFFPTPTCSVGGAARLTLVCVLKTVPQFSAIRHRAQAESTRGAVCVCRHPAVKLLSTLTPPVQCWGKHW